MGQQIGCHRVVAISSEGPSAPLLTFSPAIHRAVGSCLGRDRKTVFRIEGDGHIGGLQPLLPSPQARKNQRLDGMMKRICRAGFELLPRWNRVRESSCPPDRASKGRADYRRNHSPAPEPAHCENRLPPLPVAPAPAEGVRGKVRSSSHPSDARFAYLLIPRYSRISS